MANQKQKDQGREIEIQFLTASDPDNWQKRALNDISELEELGNLTDLAGLYLNDNQLATLPEAIGQLTSLQWLYISGNQLATLPEAIGQLTSLQRLYLNNNQLATLPEAIGQLTSLQRLYLNDNQLAALPEAITLLTSLRVLYLNNNQLTTLPVSLISLKNLEYLELWNNPLSPALQIAYKTGQNAVKAYLWSLAEPGQREALYEAKLVLVGEGKVGKTTLLKALTGREPKAEELTTHGVAIDTQPLPLPHPENEGVNIQFNAWDFGGQEVYRMTHQFFFSRRSIYLLVWEPRMGVQQCQVEDWLKMIQLRVGDDARVIIVSTHSQTGERIARIDKQVFNYNFGSMIVGFLEVDSLIDDPATGKKVGITALKKMIAEAACNLEHMGMEFNRSWREVRDELLTMPEPRIAYPQFLSVCNDHGLDEIAAKTLANLLHDLGYIVYYGDDDRLKDDVVLQPQWLIKAIGFVLEDRMTQEMDGILPDARLKEVWDEHPFENEPRYPAEVYPFFLQLMQKYDVLYRLEDGKTSLVAQDVPQVRPGLPWLPEVGVAPDRRRIAMVCVMEEAPPGLVPWMIVRTHQYAHELQSADGKKHRLHWQKGMFLRNKSHGEAMLELREREFHIYVEAVWPEYFMNVLQQTLHKLITDNWQGLKDRYYFGVPCREEVNGKPCDGRFNIAALRRFLDEGDVTLRCQMCYTRQNIVELLYGFREENLREQLARIEKKVEGVDSRLANTLMAIMRAVANESKEGPRLFTIEPVDGNWYQPMKARYRLMLWCEAENCYHPVAEAGKGTYEFEETRDWVKRIAPYAHLVASVLQMVLPIVGYALNDPLDRMEEATSKLTDGDPSHLRQGMLSDEERSGILTLHALLRKIDPHHEKLGLRRMAIPTGDYLWLCQTHYAQMQPKIPESIQ